MSENAERTYRRANQPGERHRFKICDLEAGAR